MLSFSDSIKSGKDVMNTVKPADVVSLIKLKLGFNNNISISFAEYFSQINSHMSLAANFTSSLYWPLNAGLYVLHTVKNIVTNTVAGQCAFVNKYQINNWNAVNIWTIKSENNRKFLNVRLKQKKCLNTIYLFTIRNIYI